ncbi:MAG: lipopolysaccharide assembly protein LapA domain-containing protein [Rhodospirillales bacterium]|jgi:uncharacterized integral membrane protein|nr:hypothetical protein [Rhodospirillaceae bacterium]MDP6428221.1 lipopolysaccharide assembly protein LapA domain-containing protein [Rhodospirillales bacterium]MDP6643295.1 lipopolysaccharide assembly protein LapA domain-containing protein [Rhodospirillales bacterium]MDP6841418.1 lipopolysaccharide assembly protein LapA domain-containing protein [Rhodospirillales bacterium]
MGRIIAFFTMVLVGFLLILFSISNRAPVSLDFWPLPFTKPVPVYSIVIATAVLAFLAGGIVAWYSGGRARRRARLASRRAHNLEKDLSTLNERIDDLEKKRKSES